MRAMILAAVLAGGSGASTTPGTASPRPAFVINGVERAVGTTSAQASIVMPMDGRVTSLNWTQVTPGIDGIGAGNGVFRVAVTVGGEPVCVLDVACDAPRADYVATCNNALWVAGQDVDVRATSAPCLTPPAGFPSLSAEL